jgi:hypothetical protein
MLFRRGSGPREAMRRMPRSVSAQMGRLRASKQSPPPPLSSHAATGCVWTFRNFPIRWHCCVPWPYGRGGGVDRPFTQRGRIISAVYWRHIRSQVGTNRRYAASKADRDTSWQPEEGGGGRGWDMDTAVMRQQDVPGTIRQLLHISKRQLSPKDAGCNVLCFRLGHINYTRRKSSVVYIHSIYE